LDNDSNPVFKNGRPKWIRPICRTLHGEVYTHLVSHLHILDIIEIKVTANPEWSYQSENVFFNENAIKIVGKFNKGSLKALCDNDRVIFGNKGKAVHHEKIDTLDHSLMLIHTNDFDVVKKPGDDPERPKFRLVFSYHKAEYDFPITDPAFSQRYQTNPDFLRNIKELFLCVSLGILLNEWHYKLVAGIVRMDVAG
jgi:hypothetical protein